MLTFNLGYSTLCKTDLKTPSSIIQKLSKPTPGWLRAHYRLGVAYDRIGELAKAGREFQLHDELKQRQAAEVESRRRAVKQFMVAGQPTYPVAH